MLSAVNRTFHEILPFFRYLRMRSAIRKELESFAPGCRPSQGPTLAAIHTYCTAKPSDLEEALASQQARAIALDEKTFKHASSIATALTVASAATTAVSQLLSTPAWKLTVVGLTVPAIAYVSIGGLLGIAAARTLQVYGTGIAFKLEQQAEAQVMKPYVLAEALACQERMNHIRVARNEAAFMSIRNGFICMVLAICVVLVGAQFSNKPDAISPKIWPAGLASSSN